MQIRILLFISLLLPNILFAQHQEVHIAPHLWKGKKSVAEDSTSLLFAFKHGKVHGNLRYFFMATENKGHLTDSYAQAAGGGLFYETSTYKGFQMGVGGYFIFNTASSDISKVDPYTNAVNRYEASLFDIENPENKHDLDRLEELYLKYNFGKSHIIAGKQLINTPFINLQDGRMRPTEVGGLYGEIFPGKKNITQRNRGLVWNRRIDRYLSKWNEHKWIKRKLCEEHRIKRHLFSRIYTFFTQRSFP
jgi:hypothetical protein